MSAVFLIQRVLGDEKRTIGGKEWVGQMGVKEVHGESLNCVYGRKRTVFDVWLINHQINSHLKYVHGKQSMSVIHVLLFCVH